MLTYGQSIRRVIFIVLCKCLSRCSFVPRARKRTHVCAFFFCSPALSVFGNNRHCGTKLKSPPEFSYFAVEQSREPAANSDAREPRSSYAVVSRPEASRFISVLSSSPNQAISATCLSLSYFFLILSHPTTSLILLRFSSFFLSYYSRFTLLLLGFFNPTLEWNIQSKSLLYHEQIYLSIVFSVQKFKSNSNSIVVIGSWSSNKQKKQKWNSYLKRIIVIGRLFLATMHVVLVVVSRTRERTSRLFSKWHKPLCL